MSGRSVNLTAHTFASNWQLPFLKKRKEKRKYVARPGIEPRTPDLRVRCPTDCATRPGLFLWNMTIKIIKNDTEIFVCLDCLLRFYDNYTVLLTAGMCTYYRYKHFNELLLRLSHYNNNFSTESEIRLLLSSQGKSHYLLSISDKTRTVDVPYSTLGSC